MWLDVSGCQAENCSHIFYSRAVLQGKACKLQGKACLGGMAEHTGEPHTGGGHALGRSGLLLLYWESWLLGGGWLVG